MQNFVIHDHAYGNEQQYSGPKMYTLSASNFNIENKSGSTENLSPLLSAQGMQRDEMDLLFSGRLLKHYYCINLEELQKNKACVSLKI